MKAKFSIPAPRARGFTLIELLVVIAIIGVLAAAIFPAYSKAKSTGARKRIQTELRALETAINKYQSELGTYPPENKGLPALNPLYYELLGMTNNNGTFQTLAGEQITSPSVFFGPNITGFVNVSRGSGDEVQRAKPALTGLKPTQYLPVLLNGQTNNILGVTDKGPLMYSNPSDPSGTKTINPWRYSSSSATNNPGKYDLWIDVVIDGKTNRFSNWAASYELVAY